MFRAPLNYSAGRVHCCISEWAPGIENGWELALLWKGKEIAKMRTTSWVSVGHTGSTWDKVPLSQPHNFSSYFISQSSWEGGSERAAWWRAASQGQPTTGVEETLFGWMWRNTSTSKPCTTTGTKSHLETLLPSLCLRPTSGTCKVSQQLLRPHFLLNLYCNSLS